ncbi:hypothetical protein [Paraburkholderia lycopersici]|uniref:Uncharacterized protein n=1 Tax=Paraburkholderia lycopersici TaxID=416944 RepID=A0A1G6Z1L6_9BURK|nr:hypothetical protein [Paraburkholderia lycopersici]SDD96422.1 hypothetical protein SAMN05421548_12946 [Paraburkholderia lycopersici]
MQYDDLIRDARNRELMQSTRLRAALNAVYSCCKPAESLERVLETLDLNFADAKLLIALRYWVERVAPEGPLPMSPEDAIALAERVYKINGGK